MSAVLFLAALSVLRQVSFPGAEFGRIPKFDQGYLLYLRQPCELTVHEPSGRFQFRVDLHGPGQSRCSPSGSAAAPDGSFGVSMGYPTASGHAGGIAILDASGKQTDFINT